MTESKRSVGIIGLGSMGGAFAERMQEQGFSLHICDVRADIVAHWGSRGAIVHKTPRELADRVEYALLALPTGDIVETVTTGPNGLLEGSAIRYIVDLSTTGADVTRRVATQAESRSVAWVDAPVSGGVSGARAGTVAIMLACSEAHSERLEPLLGSIGRIFHVGTEPGLGQIMKALNNMMSACAMIISGEVTAVGVKAGLDPDRMIEVFNAGSGRNSATLDKYPKAILPGAFQLGFTNRLMFKDIELCLASADELGVQMPTGIAVRDAWRDAMALVGPDADFSRIVCKSEQDAGVEVRSRQAR